MKSMVSFGNTTPRFVHSASVQIYNPCWSWNSATMGFANLNLHGVREFVPDNNHLPQVLLLQNRVIIVSTLSLSLSLSLSLIPTCFTITGELEGQDLCDQCSGAITLVIWYKPQIWTFKKENMWGIQQLCFFFFFELNSSAVCSIKWWSWLEFFLKSRSPENQHYIDMIDCNPGRVFVGFTLQIVDLYIFWSASSAWNVFAAIATTQNTWRFGWSSWYCALICQLHQIRITSSNRMQHFGQHSHLWKRGSHPSEEQIWWWWWWCSVDHTRADNRMRFSTI
jgi:hypothetical protein